MERRAKERLIGASILVALIVLVVPELLSGPKPAPPATQLHQLPAVASSAEPIRNVTVDLATSKASSTPDAETASAPAPIPTPAATVPQPAAPVAETMIGPPKAAVAAPVESASPAPISKAGTGRGEIPNSAAWAVQLGSFASRSNADNLTRQLKAQGFAVYILSGGSGTATRHRVRVGPLADRDSAERTVAKLKALGHPSSLVSPGA